MSEDREFLSAALAARVDAFGHCEHVRVAFAAARATGADAELVAVICRAVIRAIAAKAGADGKYHETITVAWADAVAARVRTSPADQSFDAFFTAHPELLDRDFLLRSYSRERLFGDEARHTWLPPDLAPLS